MANDAQFLHQIQRILDEQRAELLDEAKQVAQRYWAGEYAMRGGKRSQYAYTPRVQEVRWGVTITWAHKTSTKRWDKGRCIVKPRWTRLAIGTGKTIYALKQFRHPSGHEELVAITRAEEQFQILRKRTHHLARIGTALTWARKVGGWETDRQTGKSTIEFAKGGRT